MTDISQGLLRVHILAAKPDCDGDLRVSYTTSDDNRTPIWVRASDVIKIDECVAPGGHCFVRTGKAFQQGMGPLHHEEACKHCPKKRFAIAREPWEYVDV